MNLREYRDDYLSRKTPESRREVRQSSAFLLLALASDRDRSIPNNRFIKEWCEYLINEIDDLERQFELGEVLIALTKICTTHNSALSTILRKQLMMCKELRRDKRTKTSNDIFQYNWEAKFLHALAPKVANRAKKSGGSRGANRLVSENICSIDEHAKLLLFAILEILDSTPKLDDFETNYLAVGLEALTSLYPLVHDHIGENDVVRLEDYIFELFYHLCTRRNSENGLFYFRNRKDARLDITGHVLNGFLVMLDPPELFTEYHEVLEKTTKRKKKR